MSGFLGSGSGSGTSFTPAPDIQYFASSGTWTKPANARYCQVILIGAGNGGDGGWTDIDTPGVGFPSGGAEALGGFLIQWNFPASTLGATETITIGAGGAGGAGGLGPIFNSLAGSLGGASFFGGTTVYNSKLATLSPNDTPDYRAPSYQFGNTSASFANFGSSNIGSFISNASGRGGSGDANVGEDPFSPAKSAARQNIAFFPPLPSGTVDSSGAARGAFPGGNGTAGTAGVTDGTSIRMFGTGGAGGACGSLAHGNGGNGGAGGAPGGAGGGGGGAFDNGAGAGGRSGNGGNGANGGCYIITYF